MLDRTIDRETEEVVSFVPRTLLKRHPWSAGSSQRPRARAAAEIQPFETTDPDAPCVGKCSRLVSNVAPLCHRSANYLGTGPCPGGRVDEVVPGFVEVEVAVPRSRPAVW